MRSNLETNLFYFCEYFRVIVSLHNIEFFFSSTFRSRQKQNSVNEIEI